MSTFPIGTPVESAVVYPMQTSELFVDIGLDEWATKSSTVPRFLISPQPLLLR